MSNKTNSSRSPKRSVHRDEPENLKMILSPSEEDEREGILGLVVEHDLLTPEQRRKIRLRRRNTMLSAGLVFAIAVVMIIAIISPQLGWFKRKDFSGSGNGTSVSFTVAPGASTIGVANQLEKMGVIADADRFLSVYSDMGEKKYIQPGEYNLQEEMSSQSALDVLLRLNEANQVYIALAQTLRIEESLDIIAQATGVSRDELNKFNQNPQSLGVPANFPSLEGWMHPGEYRFDQGTDIKDIMQSIVDETKKALSDAGVKGDEQAFYVLTVASIVEFEGITPDYKAIAGAIENRINNPDGETSGYIQSDATVAYGLGKKTVHITNEQKQDPSNKYNTFYYKGLPAGPIGSPGTNAIDAAANPDKNDYYFWVTVNLDTGETKFAKTYRQHLKNVEEYDRWCREHDGKCT
ncbi:endolytic transglycosylase MltG [Rothia sp. P7181]|uniref:endolytic transglycosylase MltG n=1 Tax=unclassified Rothia (in: high G+C Gram-positive bacteria) TaxID=2689056 RepID=UPI003AD78488